MNRTQHGGVVGISSVHRRSEVPLQPSRVVSQPAIRPGLGRPSSTHRAQIDGHIGKGPGSDIATSDSSG